MFHPQINISFKYIMEEFKRIPPKNRDVLLKIDNDITLLRGEVLEIKVILEKIIKQIEQKEVKTNNASWFGY